MSTSSRWLQAFCDFDGFRQGQIRGIVLIEIDLALADDVQQLGRILRLRRELALDALVRERQQLGGRHVVLAGEERIGGPEDRRDELLHFLGVTPLCASDLQLPQRNHEARTEREDDGDGRAHREPVAPRELAEPVPGRIRAREHGLAVQISANVVGEGGDREIAFFRPLLQRLLHDVLEITG